MQAESVKYAYRYTTEAGAPLRVCPTCGHQLDVHEGVVIEYVKGFSGSEVPSKLDADGNLVDVNKIVADGNHSATLCGGCDEQLTDLPDVVEVLL